MDGLLLDTEKFYTVAQQQILAAHGKHFTWELKAKMMGQKALDAARILVEETGLQGVLEPQHFLKQREAVLDALFPTAQLMPGAERLVRHLAAHGVPMAVATSSHRRHFDVKTSQHGELFSLFDHIITGDQVSAGKPDPQIFQLAASRFSPPPASPGACLVFEDAPSGVAAALAAGMHCVMAPDPNLSRDLCGAASQVLGSLGELRLEEWGLPPFPATPATH